MIMKEPPYWENDKAHRSVKPTLLPPPQGGEGLVLAFCVLIALSFYPRSAIAGREEMGNLEQSVNSPVLF